MTTTLDLDRHERQLEVMKSMLEKMHELVVTQDNWRECALVWRLLYTSWSTMEHVKGAEILHQLLPVGGGALLCWLSSRGGALVRSLRTPHATLRKLYPAVGTCRYSEPWRKARLIWWL